MTVLRKSDFVHFACDKCGGIRGAQCARCGGAGVVLAPKAYVAMAPQAYGTKP